MCRWFAYVSESENCLLEDVLVTPKHSLAKQVHEHYLPKLISHDPHNITTQQEINARNRLFNIDGLGVAWYTDAKSDFIDDCTGLRPSLYKTVQLPMNDLNFRSICANTSTKVCFAHIRAATATPTVPVNNHPFVFGRHSFMHNGVISDFVSIRRELCNLLEKDAYANVLGSTDSEHLAALYMTYLSSGRGKTSWEEEYAVGDMAEALHRAVGTVISLQQKTLGPKAQPNSLNLATTDGTQLVAYRFRNHKTEQPPSLYYSTTAGVTLNRKYPDHPDEGVDNPKASRKADEHGSHVIVASEPTTYKESEWELIGKNSVLMVGKDGHVVLESVPYEDQWNVEDN
ncbi:hypothetical protein B0A49_07629 [Cryomyces minteri]|uniref:Glutamine amidotransferase type-2 domain-containing protein n=1 Tax=Cryomyces minteri TaxID=331657 RepID=A0A4U0X5S9_9PEZI|nr:hypothetical protein B0A49_07629 [Cryomyces minteri]